MPTLRELKTELAALDHLLYATWLKERDAARKQIADMAVEFQLSPATVLRDVEAAHRKALPPIPVLRPPKVELPLRSSGSPFHVAVKYRNPATGDYWKGRGPHPRWLREALSAGRQLEEFLVKEPSAADVPGDPLRAFEEAARRASSRTT
ncbi:H-NS family nucleoid-associated regulatory protein [Pseudorhodoferax soli]|uniref:DNA-binding protein H-NS n=1 Tax=Pseudorhodoferax soli TaxID=545864 RepID=A0A368XU13_9BURK|nr:H-NS histone family protein [Pseudorhodoferax soli]RCW69514.1 DNA-binding protein H-NS [Pseudorhodoferax soli]